MLALANATEKGNGAGKLKLFFGANAGVGKTYAMLRNARQLREQGVDVVVGLVETHGRRETAALLDGLEVMPRREMEHRGRVLEEFDVDAALARKPAVLLVDELAHSNLPGCRHPKRWQDVEELLAAGIDVHSTLNVQHLESINDVVNSITGVPVWETVPDRVFDAASEVVLVDLTPDDLLQRLREGKVYLPEQAERAVKNFFRKGNLVALRELALRRTADRVDDEVRLYRREISGGRIWRTRERLLACIGPAPGSEGVLRSASRMASALNAELHAVYVETPELRDLSDEDRGLVMERLRLAEDLGAITATISDATVVGGLTKYVSRNNVTKLVIGRSIGRRFWRPTERHLAHAVTTRLPEVDVVVVAGSAAKPGRPREKRNSRIPVRPYLIAAGASAATTLLLFPLHARVDQTNIAMLFLAALMPVAMHLGRGPATLAACLNVLGFDIFFVEPRFSLAVTDIEFLLTFAVMLAVGFVIARLTANLKFQALLAVEHEEQTRDFYELARKLSAALTNDQISSIVQQAVKSQTGGEGLMLVPDAHDRLRTPDGETFAYLEIATAQWCLDNGKPAGANTDTLPGSRLHYLPLKAPMRVRGVLAIALADARLLHTSALRQQLDTIAALAAIALERVHFVAVAQDTLVKIESQRLRESLLAALSHDLRTPVTAIAGIAESLALGDLLPPEQHAELIASLHRQAQGMARLLANILDMARFESSPAKSLRRDWQSLEELIGAARHTLTDVLKDHVVVVEISPEFPLLHADGVLLERVLVNLLENAAKYVPQEKRIGIRGEVADGGAKITVWDEGSGLPQGDPERLFHKFVRGESESPVAGVGLGLAICRAIVEAHGGTIHAESRRGGGAAFIFTLPLRTMPEMLPEPMPDARDE